MGIAVYRIGFVLSWAVFGFPPSQVEAPPLSSHFTREPAESLARQLEAGPIFAVVGSHPSKEIVLRQRIRWLDRESALGIETVLENTGGAVLDVREVRIASWDFRLAGGEDSFRYRNLQYRNDVWWGSTFWTGPDWTRVGKDWQHPGTDTPSIRGFRAPRPGRVRITGRVFKADTNGGGGDGVRVSIRHGRHTIWTEEIDGTDTKGFSPEISLDVQEGDAVRFVVHKRGKIFYDTTHWDPAITYQDGEAFQASRGFSSRSSIEGPWFYQMEVDPGADAGLPRIHGFGHHFDLRHATPALDRPAVFPSVDSLPLFVVAQGGDHNGLAVLWAPSGKWGVESRLSGEGVFSIEVTLEEEGGLRVRPGERVQLPDMILGAYRGSWIQGLTLVEGILSSRESARPAGDLMKWIGAAYRRTGIPERLELDLLVMIQEDWKVQDKLDGSASSFLSAARNHAGKTRVLLEDIRGRGGQGFLAAEADELKRLEGETGQAELDPDTSRLLYLRSRWLKRRIALANPLMGFSRMLFTKRIPTSYSHLVMQYYGWRARPGGGLFILENPGRSLAVRDILQGRLEGGNVLEPRLSYDVKRIVFSFVRCPENPYDPNALANDADDGFYHIYQVNVDGTGLRQLTSGPYDDLMPAYLPDGGIVFCSTRRRGYARCFGGQFSRRWHVYTLHRMDSNGGNIRTLSFHDTNEWFPAVSPDGRILYSRWDYIDRDAVTHQNLWAARPDGTNPVALWGNATASPHCTFQIQPVPDSTKIVFTASAHHSITAGSIALVDGSIENNTHRAITRLTPEVPFPEAESNQIREYYAAPWPLSERYFLVAYSPKPLVWEPGANGRNALGIYLLDAFGNRELISRDPEIGSTNPCPLVERPVPPVLPSQLPSDAPSTGEVLLVDVYEGLGEIPRGSVKELRIVQIFPKTTHLANNPPIGLAGEENGRAILGTVPVETDGSARFTVPARTPVLFQALDGDGLALQTMRSLTYLQPGECISCTGCHENRMGAPRPRSALAFRREPSRIDPGELGGRPFSFVEVVQPLLDRHCVSCHSGDESQGPAGKIDLTSKPDRGFTKSYWSLCGDRNFGGAGTNPKNAREALVPRFGMRNQVQVTPPGGMYGSRGSRLLRLLREGHEDVKLHPGELRRLATWIDLNAIFYGANSPEEQARQLRGEDIAMPEIQ